MRRKLTALYLATWVVFSVTIAPVFLSGVAAAAGNVAINDGDTVWQGQVAVAGNVATPGAKVDVLSTAGNTVVDTVTADTSGDVSVDTTDLSAGDYNLSESGTHLLQFEVAIQALSASYDRRDIDGAGNNVSLLSPSTPIEGVTQSTSRHRIST